MWVLKWTWSEGGTVELAEYDWSEIITRFDDMRLIYFQHNKARIYFRMETDDATS